MPHIGFLARILLFLMSALLAVMVATLAIERSAQPPVQHGNPTPRIVHAAGVIAIVRNADAAHRRAILNASNNDFIRVSIGDHVPPPSADDIAAPHLEMRLRNMIAPPIEGLRTYTNKRMAIQSDNSPLEGSLTKVVAPVGNDRTLVIEWLDPAKIASITLLGLSPGIWAGALGFGVAGLALLAMVREVRPIRRLTDAVARFDGERSGDLPDDDGAPDIRRLNAAVRGMQQRVVGLLRERSFVIGAISHDLRTYLTRLRLRAEAMPDDEARLRMEGDLDAMARLIDTSLAFARGTTTSRNRRALDLSDLVAVEVEEHDALGLRPLLRATYASEVIVDGDVVALKRVVCNILDNAQKFARTTVDVAVAHDATHAAIVIADDGPGVPPEERAAIFDPFHRVERSRSRATGGTGLGLAIARQIVEAHGGTIEVAAAVPEGAVFTILLPCRRAAVPAGKRS